jgi:hypothetical protein
MQRGYTLSMTSIISASIALEQADISDKQPSWEQCCQTAINHIHQDEGFSFVTSPRTVMDWHVKYRKNQESFPNRHVTTKAGKSELPPLLEAYPEANSAIIEFAKAHLNVLSSETLYMYIHDKILPKLAETRRLELGLDTFTVDKLLQENGLKKLSVPTIYKWICNIGFKYEVRRKCYYVDTHEKPENRRFRKNFAKEYLQMEKRMHRWIQMSVQDYDHLLCRLERTKQEVNTNGYRYNNVDNVEMIEFHVDDHPEF